MTWKLNLRYKTEQDDIDGTYTSLLQITPHIQVVPDPEVEEKLGDVWITCRKRLYFDDSRIPINFSLKTSVAKKKLTSIPCQDTFVLQKRLSYKCDLTDENSPIWVHSRNGTIAFEVDIFLIKNTFDIIESVDVAPCRMLHDFRNMLALDKDESEKKFCDVTITCTHVADDDNEYELEEVTFYAHKAILASRSTFFAKLFSHDMKESATNTVDLSDIEPDVLKELLTYIYTSECPNIKAQAESLLYQAEKYELSHLKALCEERLSYDLQIDNAARILLLADRYDAKQLKWNSLLFINEHGDEVRETEEWGEVKKSIELLTDLFNAKYDREPPAKRQKIL